MEYKNYMSKHGETVVNIILENNVFGLSMVTIISNLEDFKLRFLENCNSAV